MEVSEVRKRILDTLARAKSEAATRRARNAEVATAYERFLETVAAPLVHQVASILKVEKFQFAVHTPAGAVRLVSERSPEDFVEIRLDTSGQVPQVVAHVERVRGRETLVEDRLIRPGVLVEHLTDQDVLDAVSDTLTGLVEK
jgi:hypothetical protein